MKLKEFCKISTGKGITVKDIVKNGKYPVISGGIEIMGYYNHYNREANTVTIARAGSAGYVNFINQKFYLNDKCFSVIPDTSIALPKYLYYALKNQEESIISMKSKGTVPTVNTQKIGNIDILIPSISVQQETVRILDNFERLEAELAAEQEARKRQFAYYRDLLISFPS